MNGSHGNDKNNPATSASINPRSSSGSHRGVWFPDDRHHFHHHQQQTRSVFSLLCIWEWLSALFSAVIAIGCTLGLLTILCILYVTVRPFSLATYRRMACHLGGASFLDAIALLLPNLTIYVTGDSDIPSPASSSLLVLNHLIDGDWWAIFMLGRCVGLQGSLKVFLRNEYLNISVQDVDVTGGGKSNTTDVVNVSATTSNSTSNGVPSTHIRNHHHHHHHHPHHHSSSSPPGLAILAKLLHLFLDFPLVNGEDNTSERELLFKMLRSLGETHERAPFHLLFYPEGWSTHSHIDRAHILAKSNEFAKREGKPQLRHLLLPRTRGFLASLECLRSADPVVYDVTMAYSGYDGSLPPSMKLSMVTLWGLLRRKFPREIHVRIKRYSMEEVLQDSNWLYKRWTEKDRMLTYFARHQKFPADERGYYSRNRVYDTRTHNLEMSILSLCRLWILPFLVPILALLTFPLFCTILWIWMGHTVLRWLFPDDFSPNPRQASSSAADDTSQHASGNNTNGGQTPGSAATSTPFLPVTPFVSPSVLNWRDMFSSDRNDCNDDVIRRSSDRSK